MNSANSAERPTARVLIVQRRLTHYRVPLFDKLRSLLRMRGIELQLLYGDPTVEERRKNDEGELDWAVHLPTRYLFGGRVCWQNFREQAKGASLVIVTQENKLLFNHLALTVLRPARLAFWGHGRNFQTTNPDSAAERFKRWTTRQADWWFAYTDLSRERVVEAGFPSQRVTVLNNAVDTQGMIALRAAMTDDEVAGMRDRISPAGGPIVIFVGSFYAEKRIDFLIEACRCARQKLDGLQLVMVGSGPDEARLRRNSAGESWIHWAGMRRGREKVLLMATADLMLNPGLVGLGILDSFALGVPMITTGCGLHSPEIAYLKDGENGLIVADTVAGYAQAIIATLRDPEMLGRLRSGCRTSAALYTMDGMATRFADGVEAALSAPARAA